MTLKSELDRFGSLFRQILKDNSKATLRWVEVTAVDWDEQTMTATDADELPYYDVLLGVGSAAVKPVIGTDCLIAIVEGDESNAFLLYAEEAELIQYNKGSNGGLTITPELKTQLQKNNQLLQAMLGVINGTAVAEPGNGSPSALQASLKTAVTGKQLGDFSNIEDTKITH